MYSRIKYPFLGFKNIVPKFIAQKQTKAFILWLQISIVTVENLNYCRVHLHAAGNIGYFKFGRMITVNYFRGGSLTMYT